MTKSNWFLCLDVEIIFVFAEVASCESREIHYVIYHEMRFCALFCSIHWIQIDLLLPKEINYIFNITDFAIENREEILFCNFVSAKIFFKIIQLKFQFQFAIDDNHNSIKSNKLFWIHEFEW